MALTKVRGSGIDADGQEIILDADGDTSIAVGTDDVIVVDTAGSERMRVDASGRVGVGITPNTTSAGKSLQINRSVINDDDGGDSGYLHITQNGYYDNAWKYIENGTAEKISLQGGRFTWSIASSNSSGADASLSWTERMRIDSNGFLFGQTAFNSNLTGVLHQHNGISYITTDGYPCVYFNRLSSDGIILEFQQAGSAEGTISVSGSTVSYNGFSGLHESSGIATDTPIGTVVSTTDELDVYSAKQGEAGEEKDCPKAGQTRADHAKVKVSDTAGDKAVYGVVGSFNAQGKVNVASVGIGSVRVTGACAKGDLLESNGDGTAKVQSDDIVRSKTIGKVTIGNSNTGVKLVSCVLYCG